MSGGADRPDFANGRIEEQKLSGYLLSPVHHDGRAKAAFFARLGYSMDTVHALAEDLRQLSAFSGQLQTSESEFGTKYIVEGILFGPKQSGAVRIVWIDHNDRQPPRLVTAYPVRLRQ